MPDLTEARKHELENKKDTRVRDKLKEDYFTKQHKIKDECRAMKREKKEKLAQERALDWDGRPYFNKKTGNKENPKTTGKIEQAANALIGKEFAGYNDWSVAMQALLANALELNRALWYDPIKWSNIIPYGDDIAEGITQGKYALWDKTVGKLDDMIESATLEDEKLAKLRFTAGVNEQGTIVTQVTKDNERWDEMNHYFQDGVAEWAEVNGYKEFGQQRVLIDSEGTVMTKEKFQELNDTFDTSLEKFLSNRMGMEINYSGPSAAPAA